MAIHEKTVQVFGAWVKAAELKNGMKARLMSEVINQPSSFTDPKTGAIKTQDVAKVKFEGLNDIFNVSINRATMNALIEAFGTDDSNWQDKILTVETEKMRVGGKAVTALYLIPAGYKKIDDDQGYAVIVKNEVTATPEIPVINADEETPPVKDSDLPF